MNKEIYNSEVLELFFNEPESRFHIREIARQTTLHPNTVLRDVQILAKKGLILTRKTKAVLEVTANRDNPLFITLKRLRNFRQLMLSGLVEYLNEQYGTPEAIILFGSYNRGEDLTKSDIDIAIVTKREVHPNLSKFEKLLKRKIQLFEIDLKTVGKDLLTNLTNGVVLRGYLAI